MKKLTILSLAALALISCGKGYKSESEQTTQLATMNDSVNFCLGYVNGAQIKDYYLANDSSNQAIKEFIDGLKRGYNGEVEDLDDIAMAGRNLGQMIKSFETKGLVELSAWALNEKIFFQGFVNALCKDTTMMPVDEANLFFQTQYQNAISAQNTDEVKKAVKGKCGKKPATIELLTLNDSLNYAFGVLNGNDFSIYLLANDSTGEDMEELINEVNKGLKTKMRNPQVVSMAEQIGQTIKDQEANGLVGVPQLTTDFDLIVKGFIKGMYKDTTQFTLQEASDYVQNTIDQLTAPQREAEMKQRLEQMRQDSIKNEQTKLEGEEFLKENASKSGIKTTPSGLQYEVITLGKGPKPAATDTVEVNYRGTLIDGTEFDSSYKRNQSITFPLDGVIAGWTEGLQLMPVGSKFKFYIPQELGYGAQPAGTIPPYSTLIFEVELLGIEK